MDFDKIARELLPLLGGRGAASTLADKNRLPNWRFLSVTTKAA